VDVFRHVEQQIGTTVIDQSLKSDEVLAVLRPHLESIGYSVESGKAAGQTLNRPVFFGENGDPTKTYSVDGYHYDAKCGLEVEAGRAIGGNAIYRDLIQAMVMTDLHHLILAVPNEYRYGKKNTTTRDYKSTLNVANALYGHDRIAMPYTLTVIGY